MARPAGDFDYETAENAGYGRKRKTDPRIADRVWAALGDAHTVLNVGAGAGSYEPADRDVTAVEPSPSMRAQRPEGAAPCVAGAAEDLPFADDAFDAAMAMVTVHQWADWRAGVRELRRVARGPVVILTFDPAAMQRFWLAEYGPDLLDREHRRFPPIDELIEELGGDAHAHTIPIPIDCVDGFMEAYYARPEAFLDDEVRAAQSSWGFVDAAQTARITGHLRRDLESGAWEERHGRLRSQSEYDGSLTLVVASTSHRPSGPVSFGALASRT